MKEPVKPIPKPIVQVVIVTPTVSTVDYHAIALEMFKRQRWENSVK